MGVGTAYFLKSVGIDKYISGIVLAYERLSLSFWHAFKKIKILNTTFPGRNIKKTLI